jgi:hypothetical protein
VYFVWVFMDGHTIVGVFVRFSCAASEGQVGKKVKLTAGPPHTPESRDFSGVGKIR